MSPEPALEFRRLCFSLGPALGAFLELLARGGEGAFFHPHALSTAKAMELSAAETRDLYYVVVCGGEVIAYGMLRGWDEGWEVPSLGIAVHPQWHGRGLAVAFMQFLHVAARARGASRVRVKVSKANARSLRLCERCGYVFESLNDEEQLGFLAL